MVNAGGVPVAIKRIIDPRLPLRYTIEDRDLVLPGESSKGRLTVKVFVNRHGKVGATERGDLRGVHRGKVRSGDSHVDIVVDEEI